MTTTTTTHYEEIRQLRQQGDLRAAYQKAQHFLQENPTDCWHWRALAWVYVDVLKEAVAQLSVSRLIRGLQRCAELDMDTNETIWREQVLWAINRFLLRVEPEALPLPELAELIRLSADWFDSTPSLVRSVWLKGLLRHQAAGIPWDLVMAQWDWAMFRDEDFLPETVATKRLASLAERVAMAVCRDVLQSSTVGQDRVQALANQLNILAARCTEQTFLPYFQARVWLKLDEKDKAMQVFMPFARQKQREFWVWGMLADLIDGAGADDDVIACLVQGVSMGTPEPFLVKIRQKLADRLLTQGRWAEAKGEIETVLATRKQAGWKIPDVVVNWSNDILYTSTIAIDKNWYKPYKELAQYWLWLGVPEWVGLVTEVDSATNRVELQLDTHTVGRFPANQFGIKPVVGDRLAVRYQSDPTSSQPSFRVLTARATHEPLTALKVQEATGVLRISDKGFGFVGAVFVPKTLLANRQAWADQLVRVQVIPAWNHTKQCAGLKAFQIEKI